MSEDFKTPIEDHIFQSQAPHNNNLVLRSIYVEVLSVI